MFLLISLPTLFVAQQSDNRVTTYVTLDIVFYLNGYMNVFEHILIEISVVLLFRICHTHCEKLQVAFQFPC